MNCRHLLPAVLLITPLVAGAEPAGIHREPNEYKALLEFTDAVNRYANLHRILAAAVDADELCADPEVVQRKGEELAQAIRAERVWARRGDVFTPAVATFFQHRFAEVAIARDAEALRPEPDYLLDAPIVEVNGVFPWVAGATVPLKVEVNLPPLPEELGYRIIGRDLVLLDLDANLIVDILTNALPGTETGAPPVDRTETPDGPCLAHPELPMCWS